MLQGNQDEKLIAYLDSTFRLFVWRSLDCLLWFYTQYAHVGPYADNDSSDNHSGEWNANSSTRAHANGNFSTNFDRETDCHCNRFIDSNSNSPTDCD